MTNTIWTINWKITLLRQKFRKGDDWDLFLKTSYAAEEVAKVKSKKTKTRFQSIAEISLQKFSIHFWCMYVISLE